MVLVETSKCRDEQNGTAGPEGQGGLHLQAFKITPDRSLLFSDVHRNLDSSGREIVEYIHYSLSTSGVLTLRVDISGASGVKRILTLVCNIPRAARFVW
jgi:hypothetical protein